jgi:DNA invertase
MTGLDGMPKYDILIIEVKNMKVYRIHEMAEKLGVSIKTLQRWDNTGKLPARRTPSNQRYYTEDQYLDYIGMPIEKSHRKVVAYARVSSRNQRDDLKHQIDFIRTFANARGVILDECIEDIGSGLNYNRPKWNELLQAVMRDEIATIYVTYKDRFIRFGFEWFENLCKQHQTEIVVLNHEETSPDQELVEDLTSIVHVFSCRLYGLRKYKKVIKEDKEVLNREVKRSSSTISKQDHASGS